MPVIFAFFVSIGVGVFGFYKYLAPLIPQEKIVSAEVSPTAKLAVSPTVTVAQINFDELTAEVYSITSEEANVSNTPTPSVKKSIPSITPTPTKKPTTIPTVTILPTLTLFPTNSPTPISATPAPTTTAVKNYSSQEINSFIDKYSAQYLVDPNVLRHIAVCESGFNTYAKSYNGLYVGLYQFSENTWKNYRNKMGESEEVILRSDAEQAVRTAAYVISIGQSYIWPNCVP